MHIFYLSFSIALKITYLLKTKPKIFARAFGARDLWILNKNLHFWCISLVKICLNGGTEPQMWMGFVRSVANLSQLEFKKGEEKTHLKMAIGEKKVHR